LGQDSMQMIITFQSAISKAFKFTRELFSKKSLKKFIIMINNPEHSDGLKALSAAAGIFVGIIPVWGLQTLAAVFIAMIFRLNKALVLLFSQVSLPPLLPLVVLLSYRSGRIWVNDLSLITTKTETSVNGVRLHLLQYIYGSLTLAPVLSLVTGVATFVVLKSIKLAKQGLEIS